MTSVADNGSLAPELMRVLLKLADPGASLRRGGGPEAEAAFELLREGEAVAGPAMRVPADVVERLRRLDLIEMANDGALKLTPQGRSALRRALARSEPFREQNELRRLQPLSGDDRRQVLVNDAESPLAWLRSRAGKTGKPLIGDAQFQAGERLRADFTRARLESRITAKWDGLASSRRERRGAGQHAQHLSDSAIAARQRVERALEAVGPDFASPLLDVCCFLMGLEDVEKRHGFPPRSGKIVLGLALKALARHYGLLRDGIQANRIKVQHWGSADYRPSLSGED